MANRSDMDFKITMLTKFKNKNWKFQTESWEYLRHNRFEKKKLNRYSKS